MLKWSKNLCYKVESKEKDFYGEQEESEEENYAFEEDEEIGEFEQMTRMSLKKVKKKMMHLKMKKLANSWMQM